jgi:Flp pilus assembly protein TadG
MKALINQKQQLKSFIYDNRGMALVEFAVTLPFLLTLYLGCAQICDAVSANRKLNLATRTISDLTSQYSSVSTADLDGLLAIGTQIMRPYQNSNAGFRLYQVDFDGSATPTISWSRQTGGTTPPTLDYAKLPTSVRMANTSVIVCSSVMDYNGGFTTWISTSFPMADQSIMYPRISRTVTRMAS